MNTVEVKNIDGTYTLYNSNGDVVGRICTDTGNAMIGNAFYSKNRYCQDVSDDTTKFKCSECGCELDREDLYGESTLWLRGKAEVPYRCPLCGCFICEE